MALLSIRPIQITLCLTPIRGIHTHISFIIKYTFSVIKVTWVHIRLYGKKKEENNNSDHIKQLPLTCWYISFWFLNSMHWLYFYKIIMYWSSQISINFNELLSSSSHDPSSFLSADSFSLLLASKTPYLGFLFFWPFLPGFCFWILIFYLLLSVLAFPEDQSKALSSLSLYSHHSPSTFMASIALCIPVISNLCLQESCTHWFAMSVHHCGRPREPGEHMAGAQSLAGRGIRPAPPVLLGSQTFSHPCVQLPVGKDWLFGGWYNLSNSVLCMYNGKKGLSHTAGTSYCPSKIGQAYNNIFIDKKLKIREAEWPAQGQSARW